MEWSRHDRAIITVAAYIIGFSTAYIAFGVDNDVSQNHVADFSTPAQHVVQNSTQKTATENQHIISAMIESDGLRITFDGGERLLSARNTEKLSASIIDSGGITGRHYAIIDAEISRDNKYVYFCEQLIEDSETCDPYIYEVATDLLHPVTLNGSSFSPAVESHTSSWSPVGTLTVDFNISKDSNAPWLLYSN